MKYAVNISMIYADLPLLERLLRVRANGFQSIEFWFPSRMDLDLLARAQADLGLATALFDFEPDQTHPHGHVASADGEEGFFRNLDYSLALANRLRCTRLNVLCGSRDETLSVAEQIELAVSRLARAAPAAADAGVVLCVEGINRLDRPRAFVSTSALGFEIVDAVNSPHVRYQYDVYHMQLMEGNLINTIRQNVHRIGHFQIADPPGRHEPGTGEVNIPAVLTCLGESGYDDWVSLEYLPSANSADPFAWLPLSERGGVR